MHGEINREDDDRNGVPDEQESYRRAQDRGYSRRRAFYVGGTTSFALLVSACLVFFGYSSPLAEKLVAGLLDFASTVCMLYLGAGVLDRSQLLHRIGDGFSRGGGWRRRGDDNDRPRGDPPPDDCLPPPQPDAAPPPVTK